MYVPERFREENGDVLRAFLQEHPFGALVTWDGSRPIATHLPMDVTVLDNGGLCLQGHMSRENPQWKGFASGE